MNNIREIDLQNIWHPYTQMKSFDNPIPIVSGKGALLYDDEGKEYIDAISSWWVNVHGHCHPYIAEKIAQQAQQLEHALFAGFTHPPAVELSQKLLAALPHNQKKIFFSDNGSTAVEVAVKLAIQYFGNTGSKRKKIIALEHAFHGETFGTLSLGGDSVFNAHYRDFLFEVERIPVPVPGREEDAVAALKKLLKNNDCCCFIFEPLVLGAAGMLMYSPEVLDELIALCKQHGVLTIADEVMTGFGRTGKNFASDYLSNKPDLMSLSKGLTGGFLPMAITSCTQDIFDNFLSDDHSKTFFHGHSFTANPIGCAASIASVELLTGERCQSQLSQVSASHRAFLEVLNAHPKVENARQRGTIIAFDVAGESTAPTYGSVREKLYRYYMEHQLLLRPLGNTVYILPPYCIEKEDLDKVYHHVIASLDHV